VYVQRRELEFARSPAAPDAAYVPDDYAGAIDWRELDGDGRIAPGIDALSTPGHTPGHMSYRVRAGDETWLFAMDAIDLQEGIDTDTTIGWSADEADVPLRRASHDRLVALAAAEGARLVAGHCPVTWPPEGLRSIAV
jgi:glyoxylase-like metal-dependent hydrolase (beta-lactamase superfamily II)